MKSRVRGFVSRCGQFSLNSLKYSPFATATRNKQYYCSTSDFIQTANGGMQFVWGKLSPIFVSPRSNSTAQGSALRRNGPPSPGSPRPRASAIIAEFVEAETGKGADALDRRPQLAAALAAAKSAKCAVLVSKLDRLSRDVAFVSGPDGAARAVHRRRAGPGRRSVHAAPLRRAGRKGAAADLRADQGGAGGEEGQGASLGNPTNLAAAGSIGRAVQIVGRGRLRWPLLLHRANAAKRRCDYVGSNHPRPQRARSAHCPRCPLARLVGGQSTFPNEGSLKLAKLR